jgi:hypothetical protein
MIPPGRCSLLLVSVLEFGAREKEIRLLEVTCPVSVGHHPRTRTTVLERTRFGMIPVLPAAAPGPQ